MDRRVATVADATWPPPNNAFIAPLPRDAAISEAEGSAGRP